MRFHLLALPNVQTTGEYSLDGFCSCTIRFAKLLKSLGHTVILYASEENEAPCDELVTVITKAEQKSLLAGTPYQYAQMENKYPIWQLANKRMIVEIGKRKQPQDFICTIGGHAQKEVGDAHPDLICVEYSIGYVGSYSKYRVFESHVWRHNTYGIQNQTVGNFFDTVIPVFFDEANFAFREKKERFAVYVGRLTPLKGITIACQAAEAAGIPLKVIGHGDPSLVTHGAEYLGALPDAERNEWMSRATALIAPTRYLEPFGSTVAEAQLCGTPVITTDFGAFVETVEHGKSGFRCNYLGEFVRAIWDAENLNHRYIRNRATGLFSIGACAPQYQRYFERLQLLWTDEGWNSLR